MNESAVKIPLPRKYKWCVTVLTALLVIMSVLYIGSLVQQKADQKEIDQTFCLAYGDLLIGLANVYDSEQDTFTDVNMHWSNALKAAQTMTTLLEHTSYARENHKLIELVRALSLPADRATGFRLRMTVELYQELHALTDFTDVDAVAALVRKVEEHTLYGKFNAETNETEATS